MNVRLVLIATTLISTGAYAADAPKAPVRAAAQPQPGSPQVVLASADDVRAQRNDPQGSAPAKPARVARVTTCRCGGQDGDSDSQSDDQ